MSHVGKLTTTRHPSRVGSTESVVIAHCHGREVDDVLGFDFDRCANRVAKVRREHDRRMDRCGDDAQDDEQKPNYAL